MYDDAITDYDLECPYDPVDDSAYEAYRVETDITEIMAHTSESNCFGNRSGTGNPTANSPTKQKQQVLFVSDSAKLST
jgi:hypothetical protein